jgi:hypothetical protein
MFGLDGFARRDRQTSAADIFSRKLRSSPAQSNARINSAETENLTMMTEFNAENTLILETDKARTLDPSVLSKIYVRSSTGQQVPLVGAKAPDHPQREGTGMLQYIRCLGRKDAHFPGGRWRSQRDPLRCVRRTLILARRGSSGRSGLRHSRKSLFGCGFN